MSTNLTSEHIHHTMDLFLYKALEPVIIHTDLFDAQVSYILALVTSDRKRKPTSLPREETINLLCNYLITDDRQRKFDIIKEVGLDRSFIHVYLRKLLSEFEDVRHLYSRIFVDRKFALQALRDMSAKYRTDSYGLYHIVNASNYLTMFYTYREDIIEHHKKRVSTQAQGLKKNYRGQLDYNDIKQAMFRNILVAIDKYDSKKGPLTSYIDRWLHNSRTNSTEYEYGIAYVIPQSQKKKIAKGKSTSSNFSQSLDAPISSEDGEAEFYSILGSGLETPDEYINRIDSEKQVRILAKLSDIQGCARLLLDIGEFFFPKELKIMQDHMLEESQQKDGENE